MNLVEQISMYSNYSNLPNMFRCRKSLTVINMYAFLSFYCFHFNSARPVFLKLAGIYVCWNYKKYWKNQKHKGKENKKKVVPVVMGSRVSNGIYSNNNTEVCYSDFHGNFIDTVNIYFEKNINTHKNTSMAVVTLSWWAE